MTKLFVIKKYDWTATGLKKYYLARINRILPIYWFVCIFGATFIGTGLLRPKGLLDLTKFLTFSQYLWDSKDIAMTSYNWLSIAWSLVIEVQYYILVPIISFALIKIKNKLWLIPILLISLFALYNNNIMEFGTQILGYRFGRTVLPYLPFFVCGGIIAVILQIQKLKLTLKGLTFLLPILIPILFVLPAINNILPLSIYQNNSNLFYAVVTCLVIGIYESFNFDQKPSQWDYKINDFLNPKKILEVLGHLSFSAYLWHLSIIYSVGGAWVYSDYKNYISEPKFIFIRFIFTLGLIFLISFFTYSTVEKSKLIKSKK